MFLLLDFPKKIQNMKNSEFKNVLFKAAFAVIACDGSIAGVELQEFKYLLEHSLYFVGLEADTELESAKKALQSKGIGYINDFFAVLAVSELSEKQEISLLEVLIKMVEADSNIDNNELIFLQKVKKQLKNLNEEKIILNFPCHLNLLVEIPKVSEHELSFKNSSNFSGLL